MAAEPFLLAQLSDPHVSDDDDAARAALADAVRWVAALDPAPGAVLVSGDLDRARLARASTSASASCSSALTMPVHVLAGNHDDRDGAARELPAAAAPRRRARTTATRRAAVRCGSSAATPRSPAASTARLGAERLAWLDARLAEDRETPTIVAMHHLPLLIGIPAMGRDRPAERRSCGARRDRRRPSARGRDRRRPRPSRGRSARSAAAPVFTCPSTWMQGSCSTSGPPDELSVVRRAAGLRGARRRRRRARSRTCSPSASVVRHPEA